MTKTSSTVRFARPEASQRVDFLESASSGPDLSLNTEKLAHGAIPDHNSAIEHFMCGQIPASSTRERFRGVDVGRNRQIWAILGFLPVGKQTIPRPSCSLMASLHDDVWHHSLISAPAIWSASRESSVTELSKELGIRPATLYRMSIQTGTCGFTESALSALNIQFCIRPEQTRF